MKKLALTLMASAAMVLGFGMVANAYPPGKGSVTATPASGAPGYTVTVKSTCQPGETVTSAITGGASGTATCGAAGTAAVSILSLSTAGSASIALKAPATPGTYPGTSTGSATGALGTFSITVTTPVTPPGGLPATGSDGISTMTIIALGLFAVGAGLFGVSQIRRRSVVA